MENVKEYLEARIKVLKRLANKESEHLITCKTDSRHRAHEKQRIAYGFAARELSAVLKRLEPPSPESAPAATRSDYWGLDHMG